MLLLYCRSDKGIPVRRETGGRSVGRHAEHRNFKHERKRLQADGCSISLQPYRRQGVGRYNGGRKRGKRRCSSDILERARKELLSDLGRCRISYLPSGKTLSRILRKSCQERKQAGRREQCQPYVHASIKANSK